jgi:ketosteroid isomerase-like protein
MPNKELINTFYTAFQKRDAKTMAECYHDEIVFEDPAFGKLKGDHAKAMWKMLCKNAKDLKVEFSITEVNETDVKAHWEAFYTFSQTGRKVHNIINANFEFKDGKIIRHTDTFNLSRWASQAMGLKGQILGGTGFFRKRLQTQTNRLLSRFIKNN